MSNTDTHPPESRWLHTAFLAGSLLWAGVIFAGSSMPGSRVPGRFGYLAHFIEYGVFGLLLAHTTGKRGTAESTIIAIALASAYAVTDEVHQSFVPLRSVDPLDWLVDTAGAATAVLAVSGWMSIRRLRRQ